MTEIPIDTDGARAVLYPQAPGRDDRRTAALGKFHCDTPEAGARLLAKAAGMARDAGAQDIVGPMDGSTWARYRVETWSDGTPGFLMEPRSGPHDLAAFRAAGFAEVSRYVSTRVPAVTAAAAASRRQVAGVDLRAWDGQGAEALFSDIHALSCRAFTRNAYYTPITREAFVGMYLPMVPMIDPRLVFLARDGDGALLGFLFGIPDYQQGPAPTRAILKTYASLRYGIGHMLADAFHGAALAAGFDEVIHALMAETNVSRDRSATHGAVPFRRYALMGRALDG